MDAEEKRSLKMFLYLAKSEGYKKANELARVSGISERTVKNDINRLRDIAADYGCLLESVPGKGYKLTVQDIMTYCTAMEKLEILLNNMDGKNGEADLYRVARKIAQAVDTGHNKLTLEDMAEQMYLSESALKKEMAEVRKFFASFKLTLKVRAETGIQVMGTELDKRRCLLELKENHYHKEVSSGHLKEFFTFWEDRGDKDALRKDVLHILRNRSVYLNDPLFNQSINYLLLARNRISEQKCVTGLREQFEEGIKSYPEYALAKEILKSLEKYEGFLADEEEICAFAMVLLTYTDHSLDPDLAEKYPDLYPEAYALAREMGAVLDRQWNLEFFKDREEFVKEAAAVNISMLLQLRFGMAASWRIGNYILENGIKKEPLGMLGADAIADMIANTYGVKINEYLKILYALTVCSVVDQIPYPYRKRRLLVCSRNGLGGAKMLINHIIRNLGDHWIGQIKLCEFYIARKYPAEDYDYMIGDFKRYAYRYAWPYVEVQQIPDGQELRRIYEEIILSGYDFSGLWKKCGFSDAYIHTDFVIGSIEDITQLVAYQWGRDMMKKEALKKALREGRYLYLYHKTLYVFVPAGFTDKNVMELFRLKKSLYYQQQQVDNIVFLAVDFRKETDILKYLSHFLRYLPAALSEAELSERISEADMRTDLDTIIQKTHKEMLKNM